MPDVQHIADALSASERRNRRWAEFRMNLALARLTGDPLTTTYEWKLVTLSKNHPPSWREFRRGQIGGGWAIPLWAFTTVEINQHRLLIGAVIMSSTNIGPLPVRWSVWSEEPTNVVNYGELRDVLIDLSATDQVVLISDKHEFRHVVASLD